MESCWEFGGWLAFSRQLWGAILCPALVFVCIIGFRSFVSPVYCWFSGFLWFCCWMLLIWDLYSLVDVMEMHVLMMVDSDFVVLHVLGWLAGGALVL